MGSHHVGDSLFLPGSRPGVVRGRDDINGGLVVDTDPKTVAQELRHGYINGMQPDERSEFNKVLDKVRETEDPLARVEILQARINELKAEQSPQSQKMAQYLTSEMAHLMHMSGIKPRHFTVDEFRA
jgi:hypothetical protein